MTNYKHKDGKYIAEYRDMEDRHQYQIYDIKTKEEHGVLSDRFIEDSNDWEKIKEEDWIDKMLFEFNSKDIELDFEDNNDVIIFRGLINKHLPRITDDMIEKIVKKIMDEYDGYMNKHIIGGLIKQNLPKDLLANPE